MIRFLSSVFFLAFTPQGQAAVLLTDDTGVYSISADLLEREDTKLFNFGRPIPIHRQDDGSGLFVASRLRGISTWHHPYSTQNVYWLSDQQQPTTMQESRPLSASPWTGIARQMHFERDKLLLRLSRRDMGDDEHADLWYWHKANFFDREPWTLEFELADRKPDGEVKIELAVRGTSKPTLKNKGEKPDHMIVTVLNGGKRRPITWDGTGHQVFELRGTTSESDLLNQLEVTVNRRRQPDGNPLIDVVMIDWVKITYEANGNVSDNNQVEYLLPPAGSEFELNPHQHALRAFTDDGEELPLTRSEKGHYRGTVPEHNPSRMVVVPDRAFKTPDLRHAVGDFQKLLDTNQQADYLMISHPSLMVEVAPLAEFHRSRGLNTKLIDVQDIYDAFGHGVVHHQAIKDFISYAWSQWQTPRPRFVLLVGDASWDRRSPEADDDRYAKFVEAERVPGRNANFGEQGRDGTYGPAEGYSHRDFIPTWQFPSIQGHSASDNWFVNVSGRRYFPDLAIGRLPVVEPEHVAAIVEKTIRYASEQNVGPWKANLLMISNEQKSFQKASDELSFDAMDLGYQPSKIYAQEEDPDNSVHQARLQSELNEGQALVHFFGHGGRYIWRTGPIDLRKNHDLFGLKEVDELEINDRLSVILSMTCFTAPFDHPSHDSIGEKFLRVADRGAVALIGASWRNFPTVGFSQKLIQNLARPGITIGEAMLLAKQKTHNELLVATYNLLGDPAIEMAKPSHSINIVPSEDTLTLRIEGVSQFEGTALIQWFKEDGTKGHEKTVPVLGPEFQIDHQWPQDQAATLRVYAWNSGSNIDAAGVYKFVE
ncbi:MAG: hypothetical protein DHS20C11_10380 [Lysobacteraceae bacterium]|nr:MAG: hypothetical protein DHS20C11_10380 [Xanthomonadaceae bacterium]